MPSLLHEGVLDLIRERPDFIAQLLRDLLKVEVPHFTEARLADPVLNEPVPTEYRADAVVLLVDGAPVFGCVIEAQLREDAQKQFSWPMSAIAARARYRCPFVLVVVAPEDSVARWAEKPIALGGGQRWSPLVLGPTGIPVITDPIVAIAEPELAVLSALAHARHESETALAVARAAVAALTSIPNEQQVVYFHLLKAIVSTAARKAFEMLPERYFKYLTEEERQRMHDATAKGLAEGTAKGRAEGLRLAIVKVLESRRVGASEAVVERLAHASEAELSSLLGKAVFVERAEALFD